MALRLFGNAVDALSTENLWWLSNNPAVSELGFYQALTGLVFVLAFPVNMFVKSLQSAYIFLILDGQAPSDIEEEVTQPAGERKKPSIRECLRICVKMWERIIPLARRIFVTELLVSVVLIPLQFASLLVFTLPLTLPLITSLQAAVPLSVFENVKVVEAVKESRKLMKPIQWGSALSFVWIILGLRLVEISKERLIGTLPPRYYMELIEIPIVILLSTSVLSVFFSLLRLAFPYVTYKYAKSNR